jgi:phosphoribosylformylglycinamidine synthase
VRQGKVIELDIDAPDADTARARVEEMCKKLLANPVIERYEISVG